MTMPAASLAKIFPWMGHSDDDAFVFVQGLTAHYLARSITRLDAGMTAFVHAAAGGVGGLLVQILKLAGVHVIAAVSLPEKPQSPNRRAPISFCNMAIRVFAIRLWPANRGVDVVYDSVGRDTLDVSLSLIRQRGTFALFGAWCCCSHRPYDTHEGRLNHVHSVESCPLHRPRETLNARMDDLAAGSGAARSSSGSAHATHLRGPPTRIGRWRSES